MAVGCKGPATVSPSGDGDGDPLALLPPGPRVVAHVDMRAVSAHPAASTGTAGIARALLPLGEDTGVDPARDVDSIVVAQYGSAASMDIVVVATGRFDPGRIASSTHGAGGVPVSVTRYAGLPMSTVATVSYSPLSPRTLLAGTNDGVHRVLERIEGGRIDRALAPWIADTLATPAESVAIAADFTAEPLRLRSVPVVDLSWLESVRGARLFATFRPPGLHLGGTLGYATTEQARAAASGIGTLGRWLQIVGPITLGIRLQSLQTEAVESDVRFSFMVDDASLQAALAALTRAMARP